MGVQMQSQNGYLINKKLTQVRAYQYNRRDRPGRGTWWAVNFNRPRGYGSEKPHPECEGINQEGNPRPLRGPKARGEGGGGRGGGGRRERAAQESIPSHHLYKIANTKMNGKDVNRIFRKLEQVEA